jgi:hypothetical protein
MALMRIRPDGLELLRATRTVLDAIRSHIPDHRRDVLHGIEHAIGLAEDRLLRESEASSADLAALADARAAMRGTVLESLPEERRYDARLVAKAISLAMLQLAKGTLGERREYERLSELLDSPGMADPDVHEIRRALPGLNQQLVRRIRAGEADFGTATHAATLAYLEAATDEALSESNPTYRRSTPGSASMAGSTCAASSARPCTLQATLR